MIHSFDKPLPGKSAVKKNNSSAGPANDNFKLEVPSITMPAGGGAIKGMAEKLQINAANGTSSFSIPVPTTSGRYGIAPSLAVQYDSGKGNSAFGLGWNMEMPSITRKTEKKLPRYSHEDPDTFTLQGAEDLVPVLIKGINGWEKQIITREENSIIYTVTRYRPRIEGSFIRIEEWKNNDNGDIHWRSITGDNQHAYYGIDAASRIADPADPSRIFSWLASYTHDDKGNVTIYKYKQEDFANIPANPNEKNRLNRCTQTYLKQILYCNKTPFYIGDSLPADEDYLFRIILDYGEHGNPDDLPADIHLEKNEWPCRTDSFSTYHAGFEIRTYRRCERIMLFHCFDAPADLPISPYLVKSLQFFFDSSEGFSYLVKFIQHCHRWNQNTNTYSTKSLPEFSCTYQSHAWDTSIHTVSPDNIMNAPAGIDDKKYIWIDLFNEGISGILTEDEGAWYYKYNNGNGEFSQAVQLAEKPSFREPSGKLRIQELESNGVKYLVHNDTQLNGFFKLAEDEWEPFKNFQAYPSTGLDDQNGRFIDLDGDGRADWLITDTNTLRWYNSIGEKGFELSQSAARTLDEEEGPAIVFSDPEQCIFLADMSGDGLTDIVRIRNGEVCYWPNMGYGKFGAKITMDDSPVFDHAISFNPSLIKLADVDGSGTTDIIYLGANTFRIWMNLNGNAWTKEAKEIAAFPQLSHQSEISVLDFLGEGTACIVYSSPLPQHRQAPVQYINLMAGKKPHLLMSYRNSCGLEVDLSYKSSTWFYLDDKKKGNPWITKLPYPVHVVVEKKVHDQISQTRFTTQFSYHHGYYDYVEREFRGFGRVDQTDTETFEHFKRTGASNITEEDLHQPPILTRTWFHTGAYFDKEKIRGYFKDSKKEFFNNSLFEEYHLPDAVITDEEGNVLTDAWHEIYREAARACKSMPLRTEVYALDDSEKKDFPYTVSETNCHIRILQPHGDNKHAVFMIIGSEGLTYQYERNPDDPRISHSFNIEVNEFGQVEKSVSVVYGRFKTENGLPPEVVAEQRAIHCQLSENIFTNHIDDDEAYRMAVIAESNLYELKGISLQSPAKYFTLNDFKEKLPGVVSLPYHASFTNTGVEKRLIGQERKIFSDDSFIPLPLYQLRANAFVHESYRLAFTDELVTRLYGNKVNESMLLEAQYRKSSALKQAGLFPVTDPDNYWWIPSGTVGYVANAKQHFYIPERYTDPFGNINRVFYDSKYHLHITHTEDPLMNSVQVTKFDYRIVAPREVKDVNDNLTEMTFDTMGMLAGMAIKGKGNEADDFTGFEDDLSQADIDAFINDPFANAKQLLQRASARYIYDYSKQPLTSVTILRETHQRDAEQRGIDAVLRFDFTYSDASGRELMSKLQAEPGAASFIDDNNVKQTVANAQPRWVGSGRTILNNKGLPVKKYDPYFSTTHHFENDSRLVEIGSSTIHYYDPVGRNIHTDAPDGTFVEAIFDPWSQKTHDANDTVKRSDWYEKRINGDLAANTAERTAAEKAAVHDDTPSIDIVDSLGRNIYSIAKNRFIDPSDNSLQHEEYTSFTRYDIEGNVRFTRDPRGNTLLQHDYDMLGEGLYQKSMDTGEKWIFQDALGRLVKSWNDRNISFRYEYDELLRPVKVFSQLQNNPEKNVAKVVYGGNSATEKMQNKCGSLIEQYDEAGILHNTAFDFRGNLLSSTLRLLKNYKQEPDWNIINPANDVESTVYQSSTIFDAVDRPLQMTLPDNSIVTPGYNEAGLLEKISVQLKGAGPVKEFVRNINYNETGQRESIVYGNNVATHYEYDEKNRQLVHIRTMANSGADLLQDLYYTYDAAGNITQTEDKAQQTIYFNNAVVNPINKYTYDAVYRLIEANGREHAGQTPQPQDNWNDIPRAYHAHPQNGNAMQEYIQQYLYDATGNILELKHVANTGSYTRAYNYENTSNRLLSTSTDNNWTYSYNEHGSFTSMPHLKTMGWNTKEELCYLNLNGGGEAWYVYNSSGQRIRKVIELINGGRKETLYLGLIEIYREHDNSGTITLHRETLHVMDDQRRIGMIETKTIDANDNSGLNEPLTRYQFNNLLGSANLELDDTGRVISYEEYHPYGTTSYHAVDKSIKASAKRYRYTSKERDEESGLYNYGARYYVCWIARWSSADPSGTSDGLNLYRYVQNNPISFIDPNGMQSQEAAKKPKLDPKMVAAYEARARAAKPSLISTRTSPSKNDKAPKTQFHSYRVKGSGKGTGGNKGGGGGGGQKKNPQPGGQPGGIKGGDPDGSGNKNQAGDPNGNADKNQAGTEGGTGDKPAPPSNTQGNVGAGDAGNSSGAGTGDGGGGETGGTMNKEWHDALMLAGAVNSFAKPNDSPDGSSEGIPDGQNTGSKGSQTVQAVFIGMAVLSVVQIGKALYAIGKVLKTAGVSAYRTIAGGIAARRLFKEAAEETVEAEVETALPKLLLEIGEEGAKHQNALAKGLEKQNALIAKAREFFKLKKSKKTIAGVLLHEEEEMLLKSGADGGPWGGTQRGGIPRGQGEAFTAGGPTQLNIATHVEGHAAAIMHQRGIKKAVLVVEKDMCGICSHNLATALPPGSTLTVISPSGTKVIYGRPVK